jgi:hypothetical protein
MEALLKTHRRFNNSGKRLHHLQFGHLDEINIYLRSSEENFIDSHSSKFPVCKVVIYLKSKSYRGVKVWLLFHLIKPFIYQKASKFSIANV